MDDHTIVRFFVSAQFMQQRTTNTPGSMLILM
jgi:hypothetical protein